MLPLVFRVLRHGIKQPLKIPKRIDQTRRHCGRGPSSAGFAGKAGMPTEIVVGDVQSHRCREIAETLGESQRNRVNRLINLRSPDESPGLKLSKAVVDFLPRVIG